MQALINSCGMEPVENETQIESEQLPLISGIPDDIAFICLARIPRKYHVLLKSVSKRWRELVCSEEWRSYRQRHNLAESWIYALCKDRSGQLCCYMLDPSLLKQGWKRIQDLPRRSLNRKGMGFEVLGKKVYLLGGRGWVEDAIDEVYSYDASMNTWSKAPSLSTPRCHFACEAVDDKIYAVGGLGSKLSKTDTLDTYDPHTNSWTSHMDPSVVLEIEGSHEDSLVLDGKIYIRCRSAPASSRVYVVIYDPSSGTWQHADADMVSGWRGPGVVIDGTLYVLDHSGSGRRIMMWHKDTGKWVAVGRLSYGLTRPPCRLVAIGKRIFVIGRGLNTVVFDVDAGKMVGGVSVSSSVLKINSDVVVISCKSVSI